MKENKHLFVPLIVYLILWLFSANYLIHGINPDSISYISVAKKYYEGHFFEAINAYWGPLFSWLLVSAFIVKIEPHIFARIISIGLTIIFLVLIDKFLVRLRLNDKLRFLGIFFFILPSIFFSFYRLTPDFLLLILTLVYVYITTSEKFWEKKKLVLFSSFLGFLMFLTKSYGLMFFLTFQTFLIIIEYFQHKKISKAVFSNYLISIILFLILISPWIYLLSEKYEGFTISSSGSINIRIVNPELNFKHPSIESGFVPPSDKYSLSAWDDPDIKAYPAWSPFSNFENLKYFVINTLKNIIKFFMFFIAFAPVIAIFFFLIKWKDLKNPTIIKILIAGLIYGLGYTTIYIENRYIWPSLVLFSLIGLYKLNTYYGKIFENKARLILFSIIIIISFIPFFIYGLNQQIHTTSSYYQAQTIKTNYKLIGNFASTNYWDNGLALSYFLDSKFYGTEKLSINNPELYEKAKNLEIDYIFDYSDEIIQTKNFEFIGKVDSIRIFRVIKR